MRTIAWHSQVLLRYVFVLFWSYSENNA